MLDNRNVRTCSVAQKNRRVCIDTFRLDFFMQIICGIYVNFVLEA